MEYAFIGLIILVVVIVLWIISTSNSLNKLIVKIDEATSGIDIALTKRYDTLTKMIEPMMLIVIGGIVLVLALALYLPLFSSYSA